MAIKRILVVDDSATERHIIGETLSKKGYEVTFAENGEAGVAQANYVVKPIDAEELLSKVAALG